MTPEELREKRERYIADAIPAEYRKPIDRARLANPGAFDRVQAWSPEGEQPGLVVLGATRRGKTRAVYWRLAQLHRERDLRFCAYSADELKRRLIQAALNGEIEPDSLIIASESSVYHRREPVTFEGELRAAKLVFIDDLSQAKLTAHYAERLFALIEYRTARALPIVFTAQMDGDRLIRKLAGWEDQFADTAACIVGRIRDYCQAVNFGF